MAFPVEKKLDLAYLGDSWAGAYLSFSVLSFRETRKFGELKVNTENPTSEDNDKNADFVITTLGDHFISGKAFNGEALIDVRKEDIPDLPMDVINKAIATLAGTPSPN